MTMTYCRYAKYAINLLFGGKKGIIFRFLTNVILLKLNRILSND